MNDQQKEQQQASLKKPMRKQWWFWLIVIIILGAVLFIPYIRVAAECAPCPEGVVCPPCPEYNQSLAGYIVDQF